MRFITVWGLVQLVFILVAVATGIAMYANYRRRLKEAVSGEAPSSHRRRQVASPMEFVPVILLLVVCLMNGMIFGRLADIDDKLYWYNQNHERNQSIMFDELDGIKDIIKKNSDLISGYTWDVGELNDDGRTAKVDITVIPREYSKDTAVSVRTDDMEIKLEPDGKGVFGGSFDLDIFSSHESPLVIIKDGETIRTRIIDEYTEYPYWNDYYPTIESYCIDDPSASLKNGVLKIKAAFGFKLNSSDLTSPVKKITLLKEVNGAITERMPLEFDEEGIARINIDDLYENFAPEYTPGEGIANYALIGEIETRSGYTVKSRLACLVYPTDDEGNDIVSSIKLNVCSCSGCDKLYDKNGKCVYGEEWEYED